MHRRRPFACREIFYCLEEGEALRGRVVHRTEIFLGEEREEQANERGRDRGRLVSEGGKGENSAEVDDVEVPEILHRVAAFEIELDKVVVVHGRVPVGG